MGIALNKISNYFAEPVTNICNQISRKRKLESLDDESVLQTYLEVPKKMKMICTTKYIYKTLFLDGRDSDITVDILDKEWKLHKIYLQQSPYFASMFSGSWNESNKTYVKIEITDPNITLDSLSVVFGSLYPNELVIEPCSVVGVLAAASLFQMDGLVDQCLDIMVEMVSPLTAVDYYNASIQYNLDRVKNATFKWFNYTLMDYFKDHPSDLREISVELMESLIRSPDLCVIQMEYSLYLLLRFWVFLRLNPDWDLSESNANHCAVRKFFKDRPKNDPEFLLTPAGLEYQKAFQGLRLENMIVHHQDLDMIIEDRILPERWLYPTLVNLWSTVLQIEKNFDIGPLNLPEQVFNEKCIRMGRIIQTKDKHTWKWNGFTMGLDLVWTITSKCLTVKRQLSACEASQGLAVQTSRHIMCRVLIVSQDVQRQVTIEQKTKIMRITLNKLEERKLLELKDFTYPILISVNLLVATPKTVEDETET